jgi:hypothetical protein
MLRAPGAGDVGGEFAVTRGGVFEMHAWPTLVRITAQPAQVKHELE